MNDIHTMLFSSAHRVDIFMKSFIARYIWHIIALAILSSVNAFSCFFALNVVSQSISATYLLSSSDLSITTILVLTVIISTSTVTQFIGAKLGAKFVTSLRLDFALIFMQQPYQPGSDRSTKGLSSFINDISEIAPFAIVAPLFLYNFLFFLVLMVYLIYISPALAATVLVQLLIFVLFSAILLKPIAPSFENVRKKDDRLFEAIQNLQFGRKELLTNSHRFMHFKQNIVIPSIDEAYIAMEEAHKKTSYFQSWSSSISYIILLLTSLIAHVFYHSDPKVIISFLVGCLLLVAPVNFLVGSTQSLARGISAMRRIQKFNKSSNFISSYKKDINHDWNELILDSVFFDYSRSPDASYAKHFGTVGPVNLKISRGQTIFIAGMNGSGKSTILLLMSGLLSPNSGSITIAGQNQSNKLCDTNISISTIFLNNHIFEDLLDSSGDAASDSIIKPLIEKLSLNGVVNIVNGRLDSVNLSSGQRRRLSILQMLLEDRDIVILDEVTSDQDPNFKDFFYKVLLQELKRKKKTIVLASHDDKYFQYADCVVHVDNGLIKDFSYPQQDR